MVRRAWLVGAQPYVQTMQAIGGWGTRCNRMGARCEHLSVHSIIHQCQSLRSDVRIHRYTRCHAAHRGCVGERIVQESGRQGDETLTGYTQALWAPDMDAEGWLLKGIDV